jgi:hypothetical protein
MKSFIKNLHDSAESHIISFCNLIRLISHQLIFIWIEINLSNKKTAKPIGFSGLLKTREIILYFALSIWPSLCSIGLPDKNALPLAYGVANAGQKTPIRFDSSRFSI